MDKKRLGSFHGPNHSCDDDDDDVVVHTLMSFCVHLRDVVKKALIGLMEVV